MIYQLIFLVLFCQTLVGHKPVTNNVNAINLIVSTSPSNDIPKCDVNINGNRMNYICPVDLILTDLDFDDVDVADLEYIKTLSVTSVAKTKGPLITLPSNVCQLTNLKNLQLSNNQIHSIHFNFTPPCLSDLRTLSLENNSITEIPVDWFYQMSSLQDVYLSGNNLSCLPYNAFNSISNLRTLDIDSNSLTTIELWTIQVKDEVNYQHNKINRFSNYFNVDLSDLFTRKLPTIILSDESEIDFDDTVYEMYNRCAEVHNPLNFADTYIPTLTLAILSIIGYTQPFYHSCTCDKYYFYRSAFAADSHSNDNFFSNWICPGDSIPFIQKCNYQSSANFIGVIPRLCKINDFEPGNVPVYANSSHCGLDNDIIPIPTVTTTFATTTVSHDEILFEDMLSQLFHIKVLDNSTVNKFVKIINQININLTARNNPTVNLQTQNSFQKIIHHIENLIESVNSTLNKSDATVALVSYTIANPKYHFTLLNLSNSSTLYSTQSEHRQSVASMSIHQKYINYSTHDNVYSCFFLPSSIFRYAQDDSRIEIVSPIVGAYLRTKQSLNVYMSFRDYNSHRSSGSHSCVFWHDNRWNDTGCTYSYNITIDRHHCHCNHLTSFALIFTPNGILRQTFLPTIITSCLSMVGLCISIILSVYQQIKPQPIRRSRRFSLTNLFSLSSTLILFILFTTLLIINYQSSTTTQSTTFTSCQSSQLNLVLATYFFVILTFVTKTLVGIYYYFTTFVHLKFHLFTDQLDKWYMISLVMIVMVALIPTIVASVLSHQWNDVIVSMNNVCWFHGIYLVNFVTIPVSISLSINMIIVVLISIRLFQFLCNNNVNQAKEKRLIIGACMWIASCVLLGILWIVGPLLSLFVNENGESSSMSPKITQWIFALLAGLEGVWVLIINILFYIRQRTKTLHRVAHSSKNNKTGYHTTDSGRISVDMHNIYENSNESLQ